MRKHWLGWSVVTFWLLVALTCAAHLWVLAWYLVLAFTLVLVLWSLRAGYRVVRWLLRRA